jgi:hypothetical protein
MEFRVYENHGAVDHYRPSMGFAPKVKFSPDSLLEQAGFDISVPLKTEPAS